MNPEVSIVLPVYRPGGFDITFSGLMRQTFKNFEIVIVDNRYELRHTKVLAMAAEYNLDLQIVHVPEHRRNGKWSVTAAAFNTGFAVARGKYIITLMDYSLAPPSLIESILEKLRGHDKRIVTSPYEHRESPKVFRTVDFSRTQSIRRLTELLEFPDLDEMCVFGSRFDPYWPSHKSTRCVDGSSVPWGDDRPRDREGLVDERFIFMRVEAVHRDFILELNGVDERYNKGRTAWDHDFGMRALHAGGEIYWNASVPPVYYFNPHWLLWTKPFGDIHARVDDRWDDKDCYAYLELQRQRRAIRANNPFDLRRLSMELEPWRDPAVTCIPRDISDVAYWRREIWPNTLPES